MTAEASRERLAQSESPSERERLSFNADIEGIPNPEREQREQSLMLTSRKSGSILSQFLTPSKSTQVPGTEPSFDQARRNAWKNTWHGLVALGGAAIFNPYIGPLAETMSGVPIAPEILFPMFLGMSASRLLDGGSSTYPGMTWLSFPSSLFSGIAGVAHSVGVPLAQGAPELMILPLISYLSGIGAGIWERR